MNKGLIFSWESDHWVLYLEDNLLQVTQYTCCKLQHWYKTNFHQTRKHFVQFKSSMANSRQCLLWTKGVVFLERQARSIVPQVSSFFFSSCSWHFLHQSRQILAISQLHSSSLWHNYYTPLSFSKSWHFAACLRLLCHTFVFFILGWRDSEASM